VPPCLVVRFLSKAKGFEHGRRRPDFTKGTTAVTGLDGIVVAMQSYYHIDRHRQFVSEDADPYQKPWKRDRVKPKASNIRPLAGLA